MTHGPLPPHERAWRHPSELAAPAHEPTSRLGHFLIGSTAAVSLLLVALLAITMTPNRFGDADPVGVATSDGVVATSFALAAGSSVGGSTAADEVLRVMSRIFAARAGRETRPSTVAATFVSGTAHVPTNPVATTDGGSDTSLVAFVSATPASLDAVPSTTPPGTDGVAVVADDESSDPPDSEPAAEPDSTLPIDATTEAATPIDSDPTSTTSTSTSTSSTTSTTSTTSTSSTSTSTTSTTSTTTVPGSPPVKQLL